MTELLPTSKVGRAPGIGMRLSLAGVVAVCVIVFYCCALWLRRPVPMRMGTVVLVPESRGWQLEYQACATVQGRRHHKGNGDQRGFVGKYGSAGYLAYNPSDAPATSCHAGRQRSWENSLLIGALMPSAHRPEVAEVDSGQIRASRRCVNCVLCLNKSRKSRFAALGTV